MSPVTVTVVVVVSPVFLASPWAQFANQLAMHRSIEAASDGSATLVPAILADCELPLLSRFRVPLDFRTQDREQWEAQAAKLRKRVATPVPTVVLVPCPYPGIRPFTTEDAARFHGRNKEVTDLLGRLRDGAARAVCPRAVRIGQVVPSTILIDEPELGLHPLAIHQLGALVRSAAVDTQIILATQSVTLFDEFNPAEIVVCEQHEGASVFRRVEEHALAAWRDEYSLGELWLKNVRGGRPR